LFNNTDYSMAPVNMQMMMHMAGIMYAPSDDWTFVMMVPYTSNEMSMQSKGSMSSMGMSMNSMAMNDAMSASSNMTRESNGLGDITLSGLRKLFETEDERLLVSLGLVLPTGSETESYNGSRLAYPMQLGTGSFRFKPGITYSAYQEEFSYGAQAIVDHALNTNDQNYKVGDKFLVNLWGSYTLTEEISASLRYEYKKKNRISGRDEQINSMMMPAGNPANSGNEKHSIFTGMNYKPTKFFKGHRVAFEIGIPIKQKSDGPQMKDNYIFILGWQKAWKQH
ncbi:MAG: transporter, partial [Bdellovibrionota bacterium]|nr:transporter [Bdellovibrionota bacterium]